jgi:cytochrome P450
MDETGMTLRRPGGFRRIRRDPLGFFESQAARGDAVAFRLGPQRVHLVSHPELVKEVLVVQAKAFMKGRVLQEAKRILGEGLLTSEGELHLRQRRLLQPLFHQDRIDAFASAMVEEARRASARWDDCARLDMAREMTRLTLAIVGQTLFDTDVEQDARDVGDALTVVMQDFDRFLLPGAGLLELLPTRSNRRFREARRLLDDVIARLIAERQRTPGAHGDLLTMLLEACDENGSKMPEQQVRDEAMTIFLAGHETTAQALSWAWYLLSEHPEIEARLHVELEASLGGRLPTAADVPTLTLTRAVVAEALRLYPPAWVVARRALADVDLHGYAVREGDIVAMSPWVIHRDERWFPEPERFDPDRWLVADAERPRFAFVPFGAGNRICIGERFAWMEAMLVLATIAQRFSLRLVPGWPVTLLPRITLRPAEGLLMTVHARRADSTLPPKPMREERCRSSR